jgi:hypothetical protein
MGLSENEQERWREVTAELARERRLVGLSRRLATAGLGMGLPVRTCVFWIIGGLTGLAILITGSVSGTHSLVVAGVDVLIATVLIAGVLLIGLGIARGGGSPRSSGQRP